MCLINNRFSCLSPYTSCRNAVIQDKWYSVPTMLWIADVTRHLKITGFRLCQWSHANLHCLSLACTRRERIMNCFLLIAALLCSSAAAVQPSCKELYASYYLSQNFNETIAHTIHSMSVQGLRLFNPRANEDNRVPTVNHNIQDEVSAVGFLYLSSILCITSLHREESSQLEVGTKAS